MGVVVTVCAEAMHAHSTAQMSTLVFMGIPLEEGATC
jgi:hypothetical protein